MLRTRATMVSPPSPGSGSRRRRGRARARLRGRRPLAAQEQPTPLRGLRLWPTPHDLAARDRHLRPGRELNAFIGSVIDVVVEQGVVDPELYLVAPDREVGVAADRDRALARVEPVDLGDVGRGERDKAVDIDASLEHALGEQQRQARLDPRNAVRYLVERGVAACDHLAGRVAEAKRRVVGRKHVKDAVLESVPDDRLVRLVARRRAADALRAVEPLALEVLAREE